MFKNFVAEGRHAAVNGFISNPLVLKMLNARLARYAEILALSYDAEGFHGRARLIGSAEEVQVQVKRIAFEGDCSRVKLEGMSASAPWCQHLLEDFVEGRSFDLPDAAALALRPLARLL